MEFSTQYEVFIPHNRTEKENHDALCDYFSTICYW
jgi:hypothetical protein